LLVCCGLLDEHPSEVLHLPIPRPLEVALLLQGGVLLLVEEPPLAAEELLLL